MKRNSFRRSLVSRWVVLCLFLLNGSACGRESATDAWAHELQGHHVTVARGGAEQGLILVDTDSSDEVRLTSGRDADPDWSPDGLTIAFTREVRPGKTRVVLADLERTAGRIGLGRFRVLAEDAREPAWSPSGADVAYVRDDGIYVVNRDGSNESHVTDALLAADPTWSPEGERIAYSVFGAGLFVHTIGVDDPKPLTDNPLDSSPTWSRSGEIVFTRVDPSRADSTLMRIRHEDDRAVPFVTPGRRSGDASWSPDGRLLAFVSVPDGQPLKLEGAELFIMREGTTIRITANDALDQTPAWWPAPTSMLP